MLLTGKSVKAIPERTTKMSVKKTAQANAQNSNN